MSKKKVLIITQEMEPYTAISELSKIARALPQFIQENGMEIRILMPKFGTINERRHRLHEVVRLSGMNIIVDEDDYPLVIKVASLPKARMQVYFLDNEDFFKRKSVFTNEKGEAFEDNPDRMIFFCKGVLETVRKFGWPPDVIHCLGWMTSLIPCYIKTAYENEPLFQDSKVVYSAFGDPIGNNFGDKFIEKASINNLGAEKLATFTDGETAQLHVGAAAYSDGVIFGSEEIKSEITTKIEGFEIPTVDHNEEEGLSAYIDLYKELIGPEEEES